MTDKAATSEKNPLRRVEVIWDDAASKADLSWESTDDQEPIGRCLVRSVGYLLHETEYGVELCMSYHTEQNAGRWMIPHGCVVSMHDLSSPTDQQTATVA